MISKYNVLMAVTIQNLVTGGLLLFEGYWAIALILFLIGFIFVISAIKEATI